MQPNRFDYSPIIDRPVIRWPNGARVALWFAPNVEFYEYLPSKSSGIELFTRVPYPDVRAYAHRDYGNRVGFWRMLEVLDRYRVRPTVSLNLAVLEHFPEIRDAMVERDWAFMSHGFYNTRLLTNMPEDEEREFYRDSIETLRRHTGKQLKGMLGPAITQTVNTPDLMAEAGLTYHTDWFIDDQPVPINVRSGKLVSVPYSIDTNDLAGTDAQGHDAPYWAQTVKDQFDVLYRQGATSGRVMCVVLHPFWFGQPHRVKYLEDALSYILSFDGVWRTTADDIADYYIENYYDQMVAHLASRRQPAVTG